MPVNETRSPARLGELATGEGDAGAVLDGASVLETGFADHGWHPVARFPTGLSCRILDSAILPIRNGVTLTTVAGERPVSARRFLPTCGSSTMVHRRRKCEAAPKTNDVSRRPTLKRRSSHVGNRTIGSGDLGCRSSGKWSARSRGSS